MINKNVRKPRVRIIFDLSSGMVTFSNERFKQVDLIILHFKLQTLTILTMTITTYPMPCLALQNRLHAKWKYCLGNWILGDWIVDMSSFDRINQINIMDDAWSLHVRTGHSLTTWHLTYMHNLGDISINSISHACQVGKMNNASTDEMKILMKLWQRKNSPVKLYQDSSYFFAKNDTTTQLW